jgi:phosphate butyryltransferase
VILQTLEYPDDMEIVDAGNTETSLQIMIELVRGNQCNAIMKGNMDTKEILGAIVKKENGLVAPYCRFAAIKNKNLGCGLQGQPALEKGVLNSITLSSVPSYHKLMMVADPGMIICPTLEQKVGMIHNCLAAFRALGYRKPKVAILSCLEKVNPKIESTMHASALTDMADAGVFGECELYGPLSYDLIVSKKAAEIKGVESGVCGDADLIIVPDINCGNTLVKTLSYSAGAVGGGVTLGAKIPVIVPSRASSTNSKYYAIVVGCALQSTTHRSEEEAEQKCVTRNI